MLRCVYVAFMYYAVTFLSLFDVSVSSVVPDLGVWGVHCAFVQ